MSAAKKKKANTRTSRPRPKFEIGQTVEIVRDVMPIRAGAAVTIRGCQRTRREQRYIVAMGTRTATVLERDLQELRSPE